MPEELIALLAAMFGKKGGVDLSSKLNDPFLALLSGTWQGEPTLTEGEIYAREAPTLMSIPQTEPPDSWRSIAAGRIASGEPAYKVKEDLLAQYASNPEIFGVLSSEEAMKFIDELSKENQAAQSALTKQLDEKDYFQERGLPGARQRYTPEDIVQMYPKAFEEVSKNIATPPAQIKAMLDRISEAGKRTVMVEKKEPTEQQKAAAQASQNKRRILASETARLAISNGIARQYGLTQSQVMRPDPNDIRQVRANEEYNAEIERSSQVLGGGMPNVGGALAKGAITASMPFIPGLRTIGKILSYNPEEARQKREAAKIAETTPKEPEMVVSKSAQESMKKMGDLARMYVSRARGGEDYNQRFAGALAERLAQRTEEAGRTPLMDAILRQALVARAFGK